MELDRIRGVVIGAACGDALGAGVEFMSPASIAAESGEVRDLIGGGTFRWRPGETTDDTDLTLCLLDSYLAHRGDFDPGDFASRLEAWLATGPVDVGNLTRSSIRLLGGVDDPVEAGRIAWEDSGRRSSGNGSVMRCAPTALFRHDDPTALASESRTASAITHYDPRAQDACVVVNTVIAALLTGAAASEAVDEARHLAGLDERTREALALVDREAFNARGYSLGTMQIALAALLDGLALEDALVGVVALGYDTDTNAAVAGAVLGARDGYGAIPARWRDQLLIHDELLERAFAVHSIVA